MQLGYSSGGLSWVGYAQGVVRWPGGVLKQPAVWSQVILMLSHALARCLGPAQHCAAACADGVDAELSYIGWVGRRLTIGGLSVSGN